MSLVDKINEKNIPNHVAIIMDGNGRWAQKQGKFRFWGHHEGVVSVKKIIETAANIGIRYLTLYAFSTENWNRPDEEVNAIMDLMITSIDQMLPEMIEKNVRLQVIGDMERLPEATMKSMKRCIRKTQKNQGITVLLALSYSSKWEIVSAIKHIIEGVKKGIIDIENIDEKTVSDNLETRDIPDPDLLIRTGGELRISNFLLWQLAYSELYFTDTYWPEFREEDLYKAIIDYQNRERRFGKTGDQIKLEIPK